MPLRFQGVIAGATILYIVDILQDLLIYLQNLTSSILIKMFMAICFLSIILFIVMKSYNWIMFVENK